MRARMSRITSYDDARSCDENHQKDSTLVLKGVIRNGKGDLSYWTEKREPFYTQMTGMNRFPGSPNVHLLGQTFPIPTDPLAGEGNTAAAFRSAGCQRSNRPLISLRIIY
jgi:hypothetical protein